MGNAPRSSRDVIIQVRSLDEAARFYEGVLGLVASSRSPTLVVFETGSFTLYVQEGVLDGPVFDLLVDDPQVTKAELLAAGCVLVEEDASVPRIYLRDPHGLVFNLGRAESARPAE
jgi:catechol 2,3-dioxygenase-like lactoylglutathione lyase family enzyme